jgi:hypothetical protein
MSDPDRCWICHSPRLVYTDVIGCHWCSYCYDDVYLGDK